MPNKDWNRVMVDAAAAQDILRQTDGSIDWGDINIGHLDTGITRHPVFGDWTPRVLLEKFDQRGVYCIQIHRNLRICIHFP